MLERRFKQFYWLVKTQKLGPERQPVLTTYTLKNCLKNNTYKTYQFCYPFWKFLPQQFLGINVRLPPRDKMTKNAQKFNHNLRHLFN